jgi:hypothetical protein
MMPRARSPLTSNLCSSVYDMQPLEFADEKLDALHVEARNVGSSELDGKTRLAQPRPREGRVLLSNP